MPRTAYRLVWVKRFGCADTPAGSIAPRPAQEHLTSGDGWVERLLGRSLSHFAGVWGFTTNGTGHVPRTSLPTADATLPIDWTTEDEPRDQDKPTSIGASGAKTAWLQRFLLHTGRDGASQHDHGIEVVLPGKK